MERRVRSKQAWNNLIFMKYRKVVTRVTAEHLILGAVPNKAWTASAAAVTRRTTMVGPSARSQNSGTREHGAGNALHLHPC